MSVQSNIKMYYEELVEDLKERKQWAIEDEPSLEPFEAEARAMDDGLMYYADQAYVLAQALMNGTIKWGEPIEWQDVYDMLLEDMKGGMDE